MFSIFNNQKKQLGSEAEFKIEGMHCPSCVMNIDGTLEDSDGILSSTTSYQKGITKVKYDPQIITEKRIIAIIKDAGYQASQP